MLCRGSCTFSPIRCPLDVSHLGWRRTMFFQVDPGSSTGHVMCRSLSTCHTVLTIQLPFVTFLWSMLSVFSNVPSNLSSIFPSDLYLSGLIPNTIHALNGAEICRDETHHEGKYQVNCCLERLVKCCISLILCLRLILYLHISASHIHIQHILLAGKKRKHQNHWNIPPCRSSGQKESSKHVLFQATNRTRTKRSPQPRDLRKPIMLHSKD